MKAVFVSLFLALTQFAVAAPNAGALLSRPQLDLGLQISLTTSGYKFDFTHAAPTAPVNANRQAALPRGDAFSAAVVLVNLSRAGVPLHYPSEIAAANRFAFRVLEADGTVVWESESAGSLTGTSKEVVLGRKGVLRRTLQIPLRAGGAWLPTGRYTLEARAGSDGPTATSIFEVASPETPQDDTGISGRIYTQGPRNQPTGVIANIYISQFGLNVSQVGPAFYTTVVSNADGYYQAVTPPGSYFVTVTPAVPIDSINHSLNPVPYFGGIFVRLVTVEKGKFTTYDYAYPGVIVSDAALIPRIDTLQVKPRFIIFDNASNSSSASSSNSVGGVKFTFQITASGSVPTGGYSNPRLVKHVPYLPEAGVVEYDFLIDPPSPGSVTTQAFEKHTATLVAQEVNVDTVVRVYARDNSRTEGPMFITVPVNN